MEQNLELLKKLSVEKVQTMLMVTHDDDFAARSDKIIHLVDGSLEEVG